MNKSKYQEALYRIGRNYYLSQESGDFEHFENLYLENKKTLQELVDLTKSGEYYNKKDLIDELDKVYKVAKKHYDLILLADIYRIIEKVVQDE